MLCNFYDTFIRKPEIKTNKVPKAILEQCEKDVTIDKFKVVCVMKLQDIADMKDYLENRCYCPGEIYETNGYFYQVFKPETECVLLADGQQKCLNGKFVIAKAYQASKDSIIYIDIYDNKVNDCVMFDATENNKKQILAYMNGEIDEIHIDRYVNE